MAVAHGKSLLARFADHVAHGAQIGQAWAVVFAAVHLFDEDAALVGTAERQIGAAGSGFGQLVAFADTRGAHRVRAVRHGAVDDADLVPIDHAQRQRPFDGVRGAHHDGRGQLGQLHLRGDAAAQIAHRLRELVVAVDMRIGAHVLLGFEGAEQPMECGFGEAGALVQLLQGPAHPFVHHPQNLQGALY